jgi:hypothetical protein
MDEWRAKLAEQLIGHSTASTGGPFRPDPATQLEIAFGQARSELVYVLELARANRAPITGSLTGNEAWLRLGDSTLLRFTLDRREGAIAVSVPGQDEVKLRWNADAGNLQGPEGAVEMTPYVRRAIDATVAAWRSTKDS